MTGYDAEADGRARRPLRGALALVLVAFLAGLAAMAWLLSQWPPGARLVGLAPPPAAAVGPAARPGPVAMPAFTGAVTPEMLPQRIAYLERRLTGLESASRDAAGSADRAERLLIAFAARRALDRGVALGYIEGLLRERFAATQRPAVATILTVARRPVTLEALQAGLDAFGAELTGPGPGEGWWVATRRELSSLVTVRQEGTPSTVPAERLERAKARLESGQVDVALAEVLRLPGQARAGAWIADARRYVAARRALDAIETAALLDPGRSAGPAAAAVIP